MRKSIDAHFTWEQAIKTLNNVNSVRVATNKTKQDELAANMRTLAIDPTKYGCKNNNSESN